MINKDKYNSFNFELFSITQGHKEGYGVNSPASDSHFNFSIAFFHIKECPKGPNDFINELLTSKYIENSF